jgi:putative inorganic carbon (hco3(-)) transporter
MSKTALLWLCGYVFGMLGAVVSPFYPLYAYLLDYYQHPPLRWWGKSLPELRWALMPALALLASCILHGRNPLDSIRQSPTRWILAFFVVALMVTPFAISLDRHVFYIDKLGRLILLYLLIAVTVRTREEFRWFILIMILGSFTWGWDAYWDPTRRAGRLYAVGGPDSLNDNSAAAQLLVTLPFVCLYALTGTRRDRIIALGAAPWIVNTIILCNSRGATVGIVVSALAGVALSKGQFRRRAAVLVLLGGVGFYVLADPNFRDRQVTILASADERDGAATARIQSWMGGLRLMRDYPLGAGGGGYDGLSPVYIAEIVARHDGEERTAHNSYIMIGSDYGIAGLFCYLMFLFATNRELYRIRRDATDRQMYLESLALQTALLGFMAAAFFVNRQYGELFYWLPGIAVALRRIQLSEMAERQVAAVPASVQPWQVQPAPGRA